MGLAYSVVRFPNPFADDWVGLGNLARSMGPGVLRLVGLMGLVKLVVTMGVVVLVSILRIF